MPPSGASARSSWPGWARSCGRADWPAAARFLREYVAVLALRDVSNRGSVAYDPAELVRAATGLLLDDPELLAAERRRLAHVYVDELADTDPAQLDLLAVVAGGGKPLVAFADPDSVDVRLPGRRPGRGARRSRTGSGPPPGRRPRRSLLTTSYRAGPGLLAATGRLARRLRGPAAHRRLRPLPERRPARSRSARSARPPARPPGWPTRCARRTCSTACPGRGWRCWSARPRCSCPRCSGRCTPPGVPTVVHGEDLPLHLQPAVAPLLLLLRCALEPDRLDEEAAVALLHSPLGGADPLAERRLRQGLRALALAGGDRRPSGELIVEALRDPAELAAIDRRWAAPARRSADLLATAREAAAAPGATAEDVLWAVWRASGLAERWAGAITGAGRAARRTAQRWRAEAADRDLDAVLVLFDAAARFTDRLPGARTEVFLDHVLGQDLPADTLAAERRPGRGGPAAHRARGQGPGVGPGRDRRRPGGRLAGPAAARQPARLGAAGRRARRPGRRRGARASAGRADVGAAGRGAPAVLRGGHPGPARLLVTAVASAAVGGDDHEEQPSRFLHELAASRAARRPAPADDAARSRRRRRPSRRRPPAGDGRRDRGRRDDEAGPCRRAAGQPCRPGRSPCRRWWPSCVPRSPTRRHRPPGGAPRRPSWPGSPPPACPARTPTTGGGCAALSDDRPLVDEGEPVRVTPSTMESALRCSLRWLLERHGGSGAGQRRAGGGQPGARRRDAGRGRQRRPGAAARVRRRPVRRDRAGRPLDGRPGTGPGRGDGGQAARAGWPATRAGCSPSSTSSPSGSTTRSAPVELTGRVDRLEVDAQGRLVVIDLKTGKSTAVASAELAEHPQLGGVPGRGRGGGVRGVRRRDRRRRAGAARHRRAKEAREQTQPPAGEGRGRLGEALVKRTAETMASSTFAAVANRSAGSARCVPAARSPARAVRWSTADCPPARRQPSDPADPCSAGRRARTAAR